MLGNHTNKNESFYKSSCNDLQKFLLQKNKNQKLSITYDHSRQSVKKQNNFSIDSSNQDMNKITKMRLTHNQTTGSRASYLDVSADKQSFKKKYEEQTKKHKKIGANKSLLNLLLNHYHKENQKNQTFPDSQSNQSQNIPKHIIQQKSNEVKNNKKQGLLKKTQTKHKNVNRFQQFASFHLKINNKIHTKYLFNVRKSNFCPQLHFNPCDSSKDDTFDNEKQIKLSKNRVNDHESSKKLKLSTVMPQKSRQAHKEQLIKVRTLYKKTKIQRSSQKFYKVSGKQTKHKDDESCNILNPWSTNMIKGEADELIMI